MIAKEPSTTSLVDRLNDKMGAWESKHSSAITRITDCLQPRFAVSTAIRLVLGFLALLISTPFYTIWSRSYGGFAAGRAALGFTVVGIALLLGGKLLKEPVLIQNTRSPRDPWIQFLNKGNNFAVAQLLSLLVMIVSFMRAEIDRAAWAAVIAVAFTPHAPQIEGSNRLRRDGSHGSIVSSSVSGLAASKF